LFAGSFGSSLAQSQDPPAQQSQPAGQTSSQSQPQSTSQTPTQEKDDSPAEAARKAKAKKAATKGKVFTEEDLSGMNKSGVSVVGTESKKTPPRTAAKRGDVNSPGNGEEYWRGKAQPILSEMVEIDQAIAQLREDIKKYGVGGIEVASNYKNGVAYVEDRNAQIQALQKRKATLQKQLDDLEEEGRKAGAQPAWFR